MANMETQSEEKCRLCEDCNKAFTTEMDLEVHLCFHTKKCPLLCSSDKRLGKTMHCCLCGKKFKFRRALEDHKNSHTGEKPYVCPHCHFRSTSSSSLNIHIVRKHTKEFKHYCSFCSRGFVHKSELRKHVQSSHPTEETNESIVVKKEKGKAEENKKKPDQLHCCTHCTFATKTKTNLTTHLWTHSSYRPFQCEICNKGYAKKNKFMDHLRTHTGERPFVCNTCGRGFVSKSTLRVHERIHPEERMFLKNPSKSQTRRKRRNNKSTPDKKNSTVKSFQTEPVFQHKETNPTEEGFVVLLPVQREGCAICDNTQEGLEHHVLLHSESGAEMRRCPLCPFSASHDISIKAHLRTHSNELDRCEFCDRVVENKQDHLATCKGKQTVRCKFCKKVFSKKVISNHQSGCMEDYPFVCNFCGEKFQSQSVLQLHESHLHSKSRNKYLGKTCCTPMT